MRITHLLNPDTAGFKHTYFVNCTATTPRTMLFPVTESIITIVLLTSKCSTKCPLRSLCLSERWSVCEFGVVPSTHHLPSDFAHPMPVEATRRAGGCRDRYRTAQLLHHSQLLLRGHWLLIATHAVSKTGRPPRGCRSCLTCVDAQQQQTLSCTHYASLRQQ